MLTPCNVALEKFKFKMRPDFIGLHLTTKTRTNAKGIIPKLRHALDLPIGRNPSFDMLDEQHQAVASQFAVRIQNPENPAHLQGVFDRLKDHTASMSMNIMEVSLDAFPRKGTTLDDLAWMVVRYIKFMSYRFPKTHSIRAYHEKYGQALPTNAESLHRLMLDGWTVAIGNQRDDPKRGTTATPISFRFYLKTTDDGSTLAFAKSSARMEVTMQGEAFAYSTPADLNDFNFQQWNADHGFFNFRKLKTDLHPVIAFPLTSRVQPGQFATDNTKTRNKGNRSTVADSELNGLVRSAARAITKRWAKAPACRNSVNFETPAPAITGEVSGFTDTSHCSSSTAYSSSTYHCSSYTPTPSSTAYSISTPIQSVPSVQPSSVVTASSVAFFNRSFTDDSGIVFHDSS